MYKDKILVFGDGHCHSNSGGTSDGKAPIENYVEDMKIAGMIDRLDFYIFEKTCKILGDWKNMEFKDLCLSCNITRTTLSQPKFLDRFEEVISKYNFDRRRLIIELT